MTLAQPAPTLPLCPPEVSTGRRLPAVAGEPWWNRDDAEHDAANCYHYPDWNVDAGNRPPRFGAGWYLDNDLNFVDTGEVEVTWRGRVPDLHSYDPWDAYCLKRDMAQEPTPEAGRSLSHVYELYGDSPETSRGIPNFFLEDRWKLAACGTQQLAEQLAARYPGLNPDHDRLARALLRLVGKLVTKHRDLDREEVVSACLEGLVRARNLWTPTGGATYTTYAYTAMHHTIHDLRPTTDDTGQPVEAEQVATDDTVQLHHDDQREAEPDMPAADMRQGRKLPSVSDEDAAHRNTEANTEFWHTTGSDRSTPPPSALPDLDSRAPGSGCHIDWLDLLRALRGLPDGDLLYERDLLDRPVAEIAERRGMPSKTVSNRLTRARRRLDECGLSC